MDAPRSLSLDQEASDSVVFTDDGNLWTTNDHADKTVPEYLKALGLQMPQSLKKTNGNNNAHEDSHAGSGLSGGSIAAIAIGTVLAGAVIAVLMVVKIRRMRSRPYREMDPWRAAPEESRSFAPSVNTRGYSEVPSQVTET